MIKLSKILSEIELDPGSVDLTNFKKLDNSEIRQFNYGIDNGSTKKIYDDGQFKVYTDTNNIRRGMYNVLFRDRSEVYGRRFWIAEYPDFLTDEELLDAVKEYDKITFDGSPLPDGIYQAAIDHHKSISND